MIDFNEAMNRFKIKFKNLTITKCIDYNDDYYVVEAVEDLQLTDYNCPYYGIRKRDGQISAFIPTFDLDAFFEAVYNRTLYSID